MNKKLIRLTESDLHKIVKESVNNLINEIGNTDKGQDALGQVSGRAQARASAVSGAARKRFLKLQRDARDKAYSEADKIGMYRGPFSKFDNGTTKGYKKGIEYFRESSENKKTGKIIKEWEDGFDVTTDDDDNVYYGNYSYKTNAFKKSGEYWIVERGSNPIGLFLDPKEAALYVIALEQDYNMERDIDEEEELKKIMYSLENQRDSWSYKGYGERNYFCSLVDLFKQK